MNFSYLDLDSVNIEMDSSHLEIDSSHLEMDSGHLEMDSSYLESILRYPWSISRYPESSPGCKIHLESICMWLESISRRLNHIIGGLDLISRWQEFINR